MEVSIIGSGNVAQQLAPALKRSGCTIAEIYSRNRLNGKPLAKKVKASFISDISKISDTGGVLIIAVKDDAITEVIKKLPNLKNTLVIHTSGATDISVLKKFRNAGVLWQVQTIQARTKVDFRKVPLVIEGNNKRSEKKLKQLAQKLSAIVYIFNSQQRRVLHLSAVWSNNFVNHLCHLAEQLLKKHRLPYEILGPLILSTAENALKNPGLAQTGPAKRKDRASMKNHLAILKKEKDLKKLYLLMSESIMKQFK